MKNSILILLTVLFLSCNSNNNTNEMIEIKNNISDPLSSWSEGPSKKAIIDFVTKTTKEGSPDFIPAADRIACFDNDGTLWSEQPVVQLAFVLDQIKAKASDHPEWKTEQPFKAILEGDVKAFTEGGKESVIKILEVTHTGMTSEEFNQSVKDWIATAKHPKTGMRYAEMIYKPMLELLNYLRANGYKTFIVSGGGIDFMRVFAEEIYGIPSYQVVGSSGKIKYEVNEGKPSIKKMAELNFIDDKEGKPEGIHQHIGKRPVFTAGNSDGDYAMLEYTISGSGPRFGMIIHHTDAEREFEYVKPMVGSKLERGLKDAAKFNWLVIDMKKDWKEIF